MIVTERTAAKANEPLMVAVARQRIRGRFAHQIAAQIGIHPSELSHWMYGRRTLTQDNAVKLAAALGCSPEEILPVNTTSPASNRDSSPNSGRQLPHDTEYRRPRHARTAHPSGARGWVCDGSL
jgi:plasmid maintenance system antidote protein VapI